MKFKPYVLATKAGKFPEFQSPPPHPPHPPAPVHMYYIISCKTGLITTFPFTLYIFYNFEARGYSHHLRCLVTIKATVQKLAFFLHLCQKRQAPPDSGSQGLLLEPELYLCCGRHEFDSIRRILHVDKELRKSCHHREMQLSIRDVALVLQCLTQPS